MKVRFLRDDGEFCKGQEYELRDPEAEKFIRQGSAEAIDEDQEDLSDGLPALKKYEFRDIGGFVRAVVDGE